MTLEHTTQDWERKNMKLLAKNIAPIMQQGYILPEKNSGYPLRLEDAIELAPYGTSIAGEGQFRKVRTEVIPRSILEGWLTDNCGEKIRNADIFETASNDSDIGEITPLDAYHQGIFELAVLRESYIKINNSPWTSLLAIPVAERPFFAGLLNKAEANKGPQEYKTVEQLIKPATIPEIMEYAYEVGQMRNASKYVQTIANLR